MTYTVNEFIAYDAPPEGVARFEVVDDIGRRLCETGDMAIAQMIADALNLKAVNQNVISLLQNENMQIADRSMRMELALRIIDIYAMGDTVVQDSGAVRDWLRDWIKGFDNGAIVHGPIGGPMVWPSMVTLQRQLLMWGFHRTSGDIGYVGIDPGKRMGEKVQ